MARRREELLARVQDGARRNGTDGVLMHQAIADRVGLHVTDLRCLNMLWAGSLTPGEIAERTGLTTGAVTRMIDRLLKAGFVRREHDPVDRRRVIVTAVAERFAEIAPPYEKIAAAWADAVADYTDEQLELIDDLFGRMHTMVDRVLAELRDPE
ncbi:MAG: MarR family transcriptional regulator [Mycobacteriaceae bacterium]|nr:MarR family transcriptional regulator [Mycobacteriaceae bacterium]